MVVESKGWKDDRDRRVRDFNTFLDANRDCERRAHGVLILLNEDALVVDDQRNFDDEKL